MKREHITPLGIAVAIFGGALAIIYGGSLAWRQTSMRQWPKATAKITSFERRAGRPDEGGHWYANPRVQFEYWVNGKLFIGESLNPSPFNYQSREQLDADTGAMKAGAEHLCWYNPESPNEAYLLNVGVTTAPVLLLVIGTCVFGVGIFELVRRLYSR